MKAVKKYLTKKSYLTPDGLIRIKTELELLKKTKRPEIYKKIQELREFGGEVSEDSEYQQILDELALIDGKISQLQETVKTAKLINKGNETEEGLVVLGSTVKVNIDNELDEFTIVGRVEADPIHKKISDESPLGHALLGQQTGQEIEVKTPTLSYKCKIIEIR